MMSDNPFNQYPGLGSVKTDLSEYEHILGEEAKDVLAEPEQVRPFAPFTIIVILITGTLLFRLVNLQIIEGTKNRVLAEGNRVRSREIVAPRGEIKDKNGIVLAGNTVNYALEIYPAELPSNYDERNQALKKINEITGLDLTDAEQQLSGQRIFGLDPLVLASQIDRETALIWEIKLADLPGVAVRKTARRIYSDYPGLGHILGYVGKVSEEDRKEYPQIPLTAQVGKTGLEAQYETKLQGLPGEERIEVDAKGRIERVLAELPPTQGQTIILTLDINLQKSLMNHLTEATMKRGEEKAAAVVLDIKTGGILAMASLPDFSPNVFIDDNRQDERASLLTDKREPLINRVTSGLYPSGSTIKPVIATASLMEGKISANTKLDTSAGAIQIGEWRFPDWKTHGVTTVRQAIAESNDIFFYALGGGWQHIPGLGIEKMKYWLDRFGFGEATGIDLPGEASGFVPSDDWKKEKFGESWYIGDSYHLAIGQGYFLSTPIELTVAIGVVANGGDKLTPHLLSKVQATDGQTLEQIERSVSKSNVASPEILALVREGMRQTVTEGTARSLGDLSVPVAGKTGTAQFGSEGKTHSWFVGFAPADNPEIAIAVIVEGGGESSDSAVPAAKAFLMDWVNAPQNP